MCTLTALTYPDSEGGPLLRIVMNRDEQRSRPSASGPILHACEGCHAVFPVDMPSGGTWIAANSHGAVFALLNRNVDTPSRPIPKAISRGLVIPQLLEAHSAAHAASLALRLHAADYAPFRLILLDVDAIIVLESDTNGVRWVESTTPSLPFLATSSSLGDQFVQTPRRRLFDSLLIPGSTPANQDRFHRHLWPQSPHLSVMMSRPDARTVSRSEIEVGRSTVRLTYHALPDPISPCGECPAPRCVTSARSAASHRAERPATRCEL